MGEKFILLSISPSLLASPPPTWFFHSLKNKVEIAQCVHIYCVLFYFILFIFKNYFFSEWEIIIDFVLGLSVSCIIRLMNCSLSLTHQKYIYNFLYFFNRLTELYILIVIFTWWAAVLDRPVRLWREPRLQAHSHCLTPNWERNKQTCVVKLILTINKSPYSRFSKAADKCKCCK